MMILSNLFAASLLKTQEVQFKLVICLEPLIQTAKIVTVACRNLFNYNVHVLCHSAGCIMYVVSSCSAETRQPESASPAWLHLSLGHWGPCQARKESQGKSMHACTCTMNCTMVCEYMYSSLGIILCVWSTLYSVLHFLKSFMIFSLVTFQKFAAVGACQYVHLHV